MAAVGEEKADVTAWLAVAAGTIGALMATLDTSIVNACLPTIQGEIGASGSEGTWISTAYLVAEIIMIPLAAWFQSIFGLRNFLLIATTLFILFSMWCGVSDSLIQMIIGRVGQGFTGGAMIPTALTIVATRLPPGNRPVGIALFGATAVLGPALGPVIGGWLTVNISWHYVFFLNLPISLALITLLIIGLPHTKPDFGKFADTDILGVSGLILGLGGLTVVLEEGQRERWFESDLIRELSLLSAIGIGLLVLGQFVSKRPVIHLKILLERAFGSVFLMSMAVGAALYGILYIIPQFLSAVAGYNSEQSGDIAAISGVPSLVLIAFFPALVKLIDVRLIVAFGLALYGWSCMTDTHLTPTDAGPQFVVGQIVRGAAQFFTLFFLNQAATASVAENLVEDASGLFNAARNLGGSFGLAAIATLQDQRMTFHTARLEESMSANSVIAQTGARTQGLTQIYEAIQTQAQVMTYSDLYFLLGAAMFLMIPAAFLLKPLPKTQGSSAI